VEPGVTPNYMQSIFSAAIVGICHRLAYRLSSLSSADEHSVLDLRGWVEDSALLDPCRPACQSRDFRASRHSHSKYVRRASCTIEGVISFFMYT
jgi:hypothetical protein